MRKRFPIIVNGREQQVRLIFNSRFCQRFGIVGGVWRHTIRFAGPPTAVPAWILGHELVHVWQWQASGGWWRHLWRYLRNVRQVGYVASGYEQQAVALQGMVGRGEAVALADPISGAKPGALRAPFLRDWNVMFGPLSTPDGQPTPTRLRWNLTTRQPITLALPLADPGFPYAYQVEPGQATVVASAPPPDVTVGDDEAWHEFLPDADRDTPDYGDMTWPPLPGGAR